MYFKTIIDLLPTEYSIIDISPRKPRLIKLLLTILSLLQRDFALSKLALFFVQSLAASITVLAFHQVLISVISGLLKEVML